jgi:hypothetical protein
MNLGGCAILVIIPMGSFFLFRFACKETKLVDFVLHCRYECISSLDCTHGSMYKLS